MKPLLRRGALVTFSGVDCSGKSTQLELLDSRLRASGIAVARVWNRVGYTRWFQAAKDGLRRLRPSALPSRGESYGRHAELANPRTRAAWFALACADLARLYNVTIRRQLLAGRVVLCDRYLADSHVDLRLHFPEVDLTASPLWRALAATAPVPDLALYFDVPLEVALARAEKKNEIYRQPDEVVGERIEAYGEAAQHYPLEIVDGDRSAEAIADDVGERLTRALNDHMREGSSRDGIIS